MAIDPFKLVEQGFEVFPLRITDQTTADKQLHFLTRESWNLVASKDPAKISEWITRYSSKITDWGIPTGHRNGIAVVDIDTDEAQDFWSSKWLPEGKEVPTPRGGAHVIYSVDGLDIDVKSGKNDIYPGIDTRGEGGFIVAYTDDLLDIPELPDAVAEILPEKQVYNTAEHPEDAAPADLDESSQIALPNGEVVLDVTPPEARVLKGFTDMLDALPRPWRIGAGYHNVQFGVACALNRIANSKFYRTTREDAHKLFLAHAPLRDSNDIPVREKRWTSAVEAAAGQWFDPPTDVPVRLPESEAIDQFSGKGMIDHLYWEGKTIGDVKTLIREIREHEGTAQQAYSISYESNPMKVIRERNPENSRSTWGFVKEIYNLDAVVDDDAPGTPEVAAEDWGAEKRVVPEHLELLTDAERDIVRNYPNYIDRYIMAAREVLAEPNMPLHYVNAWVSLSCCVGDRADIMLKNGRKPLSLWALPLADSAAGKGDAKNVMIDFIDAGRRGGFGDINAGGNASAEGLAEFIAAREGKVAFFNKDEASSLLDAMHVDTSYEGKAVTLALDLYDGKGSKNLRVGNATEGLGGVVKTTYNMWLQTTWRGATESMQPKDISTGFVGRFLVAIGDDPKVTDDSLRPEFASEYQVQGGGVHPMIKSIGDGMNTVIGRVKNLTVDAGSEVLDRYVDARKMVLASVKDHALFGDLQGILLRVTDNMLKGAALLAVSEGRSRIEMPDMLLALKSGQYWVRDAIRLVEAISSSDYRRRVDAVVALCGAAPRTRAQILSHFKNLPNRDVTEAIERAEHEGSIRKAEDGKRWTIA